MKRELEKPLSSIAIPTTVKVGYLGESLNRIQINHPETKSKIESVGLNKVSVGCTNENSDASQKMRNVELNIQTEDLEVKVIRIIRTLKNLKNRRYFLKK